MKWNKCYTLDATTFMAQVILFGNTDSQTKTNSELVVVAEGDLFDKFNHSGQRELHSYRCPMKEH